MIIICQLNTRIFSYANVSFSVLNILTKFGRVCVNNDHYSKFSLLIIGQLFHAFNNSLPAVESNIKLIKCHNISLYSNTNTTP